MYTQSDSFLYPVTVQASLECPCTPLFTLKLLECVSSGSKRMKFSKTFQPVSSFLASSYGKTHLGEKPSHLLLFGGSCCFAHLCPPPAWGFRAHGRQRPGSQHTEGLLGGRRLPPQTNGGDARDGCDGSSELALSTCCLFCPVLSALCASPHLI